ncbi:hypothetical protein CHUAL_000204 [Chamberlinius hualienensis]
MKIFACFAALLISVNAQLTYKPIDNLCSGYKSSDTIEMMVGTWKILIWTDKPIRCGTFEFSKDENADIFTGKYTYYDANDEDYENKITEIYQYVPDPDNRGVMESFAENTTTPDRNIAIMLVEPKVQMSVFGCDFLDRSYFDYIVAYYGPDADQATKDKLKSDLTGDLSFPFQEVYQGSDCPSD